jgi:replicative DNA helicase
MIYPDFSFVDSAFNGVNHRNKVILINEITEKLPPNREDCYITYFRFPAGYKLHCVKTGSVGGYNGLCFSDWFYMDVDNQDLRQAHNIAKNLLLYIETELELDLNVVEVFFSGAKGFHVAIPGAYFGFEPRKDLPQIHRAIAKELFNVFNLDFAIYDINRLFRLPNTKHSKTGLYKVILDPIDVLHKDLEYIRAQAMSPIKLERTGWPEKNQFLNTIYKKYCQSQRFTDPERRQIESRGTNLGELFVEVGEGSRNESCFSFAHELKKKGLRKSEVRKLAEMWNSLYCNPALEPDELSKTIDSAFRFQTKSIAEKLGKIKFMQDMEQDYLNFLRQLKEKGLSFKSFIPKLDKWITPITPGNVVFVLSGTGVGKTTFLQNVNFHTGIPAFYINLETSASTLFERFQQMSHKKFNYEVREIYSSGNRLSLEKLKHVITLDDTDINIDDIIEYWELAQEKAGIAIPFIGIDHMGLLQSKGGSEYERTTYISNQLIKLAKRTDTIVFALSQVSRDDGGSGDKPLTLNSGKGSGAIENAASLMLGLHRPNLNEDHDDDEMRIQILKQRTGPKAVTAIVKYDAPKMLIYEESSITFEPSLTSPAEVGEVPF